MAWFGASLLFGQANASGNTQLGNGTLRSEGRLASTGINLVHGAGPSRLVACLLLGATLTVTGGVTDLGAATTRSGGRLAGQLTTRVAMAGVVRAQSRTFSTVLGTNLSLGTGTIQSSARLTGLGSSRVALAGITEATGRLAGSLEMAGTTVDLAGAIQGQSALASTGINLVYPAGPVRVQTRLAGALTTTGGVASVGTGTVRSGALLRGTSLAAVITTPMGGGTIRSAERLRSTGISLVYPAGPIRSTGARVRATGILDVAIPIQGGVLRSYGLLRASALGFAAEGTPIGQGKLRSLGRLRSTGISLVYPAAPLLLTGARLAGQLQDMGTPVSLGGTVAGPSGLLYGIETTITEFAAEIVGPPTILRGTLGFVATNVALPTTRIRVQERLTGAALTTVVPLTGQIDAAHPRLPAATLGALSGHLQLGRGWLRSMGRMRGLLGGRVPLAGQVVDIARLRGSLGAAAEFPSLAGRILLPSTRLLGRLNAELEIGGVGVGRTHLWLGQVEDLAVPVAAGGELYILTGDHGHSAGDDTLLLVETPDIAPLGVQGRLRLRRIVVPVRHGGACTLRITPIVDYNTALDSLVVTFDSPARIRRQAIQMKVVRGCTVVRLRIEVLDTTGEVAVFTPTLYYDPLTPAAVLAMGGTP